MIASGPYTYFAIDIVNLVMRDCFRISMTCTWSSSLKQFKSVTVNIVVFLSIIKIRRCTFLLNYGRKIIPGISDRTIAKIM